MATMEFVHASLKTCSRQQVHLTEKTSSISPPLQPRPYLKQRHQVGIRPIKLAELRHVNVNTGYALNLKNPKRFLFCLCFCF